MSFVNELRIRRWRLSSWSSNALTLNHTVFSFWRTSVIVTRPS